jgi:hypothetical protein
MKMFPTVILILLLQGLSLKSFAQLCGNDTLSLELQWEYGTGLSLPIHVTPDEVNANYLYVAAKSGGLIVLNVSNPGQASPANTLPVSSFNNLEVMNCEQYGSYLYVALGNYFGANVQAAGMAVVNITDPENPVVTDVWQSSSVVKGAAIVKGEGDYAYLGAMTDGLIILDVSDKSNIQFVSKFIPDPNWPVENPTATSMPNARGMLVRDDVVYLCYDAGGLRIINVHDKLNPKETGRYINQSALSKQQAYNDIEIYDGLAYIGEDYCGMEIVNVADTSNMTQVSWWNPWDCTSPSNIWIGSHGHGNEVTFDAQQQVVFMSAGASDLRIIDVSDPAHPDSCSGFGSYADTLASYGASVSGDRVFISYIIAIIPYFSVWAGVKELKWESSYNVINETASEVNFSVSPNPCHDHVEITVPNCDLQNARVLVKDVSGITCLTQDIRSVNKELISINASILPAGLYFVSFITETQSFTTKMVKQE